MSKIYFASDHAGFTQKALLLPFVRDLGHEVEDLGPVTYDANDDYPDFITPCAMRVASEAGSFGVILGKSGQGEAMAANRIRGARAIVYYGGTHEIISLGRAHNNANLLSLGAGFLTDDETKRAVELFLDTPFTGDERHVRRLAKF